MNRLGGTQVSHWTRLSGVWDRDRWPNFEPREFACKHCGQCYWHPRTFTAVQYIRTAVRKPVIINSGHRCWLHNVGVGGGPKSYHLEMALDISTRGHDAVKIYSLMLEAGFTGIGGYRTFLHGDFRGYKARWYGSEASKVIWKPVFNQPDLVLA